jgi:uncharacterized membrane protein YdjX (TVP38/TMEM64 family)
VKGSTRSVHLAWAAGSVVLALLAWQGHHLARWLPQFERMIENLGPWGPVIFCASLVVLEPFLVPDTLFGLAAGAAFGLVAGTAYYFAAVYVMCLAVQWLGGHWLKARVLRLLETRQRLRAMVLGAPQRGARFTFLVRLVPVNQALLSYALGAAGVPLGAAVAGNLGMFTHMLPTVYFGTAAVHMTRMAGKGHKEWELEGVVLMLGLAICVALALQITRRAWAAIGTGAGSEQADTRQHGS